MQQETKERLKSIELDLARLGLKGKALNKAKRDVLKAAMEIEAEKEFCESLRVSHAVEEVMKKLPIGGKLAHHERTQNGIAASPS